MQAFLAQHIFSLPLTCSCECAGAEATSIYVIVYVSFVNKCLYREVK